MKGMEFMFSRKKVDNTIEQTIAMGFVVSDVTIKAVKDFFDPAYIINDSLRIICQWCITYFDQYNKAPQSHIQDLYDHGKILLEKSDANLVAEFLIKLSKRYIDFTEPINDLYFINQAKEYFTQRNLKMRSDRIQAYLDLGKLEDAENEMVEYKKFKMDQSIAFNPLSDEYVDKVLAAKEEPLLKFPGAMGNIFGPLRRGYLLGILGVFKKGKTKSMMYMAHYAASCRLKVVFVSLEMSGVQIAESFLQGVGTFGSKPEDRISPVFDCKLNQNDSCGLPFRINNCALLVDGKIPFYSKDIKYIPCDVCRKNPELKKNYKLATWFEELSLDTLNKKTGRKVVRSFTTMYGDNLRVLSYPRFSATLGDIEHDLNLLEEKEMFIPDVLIIDYSSILKPENLKEEKRFQLDHVWKRLAQVATERNCLLISASQGTRSAIKKTNTEEDDVAEWIGLLAHVDIFSALSQTPEEKVRKVIRMSILGHRHEDFDTKKHALILTNYGAGQFHIDSEICYQKDLH